MPLLKVKQFLDAHNVKYVSISHSVAYTAQEIASVTHIPGGEVAKTVIVIADDELRMAVLTASCQIDLDRLRNAMEAKSVRIASEKEFRDRFPDCELGAMPPFGNLYNMPIYADEKLAEHVEIAFNAGSHHELIRMSYKDFIRLVKPAIAKFHAITMGAAA